MKYQDLTNKLIASEWVVAYIKAPWCKVCTSNQPIIEAIQSENKDLDITILDATDPENEEVLKTLEFESLPYYAIYHAKKGDIQNPSSCFVGGETGGGIELPLTLIDMIRHYDE